jgi:hypothetical protein
VAESRDRETALWGWLKKPIASLHLPQHIQRIENAVARGTPDVEGCINSHAFWCELKVASAMARGRWRIRITPEQVRFALRRHGAGGKSWVLVRACGDTWGSNRHFLISGGDTEELLEPISDERLTALSFCAPSASPVDVLKIMAGLQAN